MDNTIDENFTLVNKSFNEFFNNSFNFSNELTNQKNDLNYSYLEFRDQSRFWIQRVLVPIISLIGVIGNSITIVIMTRRRMRSSTNSYLAALATYDMLYLIFTFVLSLSHYPNANDIKYYYYWLLWPITLFICDVSSNTSIWITVTFTIERYEEFFRKIILKNHCLFFMNFTFHIKSLFKKNCSHLLSDNKALNYN
jgi:hypothetical protein